MLSKKEMRAQATRQAILDAAEDAFYALGFSGTTLEEIARRTGVTRGAIYWHFNDKTEVFQAIFVRTSEVYRQALESIIQTSSSVEEFAAGSIALLRDIAADPQKQRALCIVLLRHEHLPSLASIVALKERHYTEMLEMMTAFFAGIDPTIPLSRARQMAEAISAYFVGMLMQFLVHPETFHLAENAEFFIQHFFSPFTQSRTER